MLVTELLEVLFACTVRERKLFSVEITDRGGSHFYSAIRHLILFENSTIEMPNKS